MPREVLEAMVVALSSGPPEIVAERQEAFLGVLSTGAVDGMAVWCRAIWYREAMVHEDVGSI